jgi:hypothetical protein
MEVRMAISPVSDAKSEYSRERDGGMEEMRYKGKAIPLFTMQSFEMVPVAANPSVRTN